ncbi:DUF3488 and transglutaminase-like domain-containing protein [Acinetobacter gyllenbergii]|uniref:transglutaminase family protein n=1 Tax=Acinetobacter gyllenbergii TaxID=134534 RepID=UPI0021D0D203|nr:DUF3488 and transglutaminase-like domain-containing protein [Acinetobacter gyllenbergii]MCU4580736.1 DUF3488 and transglutaminase-like domain-containing protein [Acinetobacter gyllenbergii]
MSKQIYFCVLAVLALVLVGQAAFAPAVLTGVWALVWLLLLRRYRQQSWAPFPKWFLLIFILLCLGLLYLNYQTLLGIEAGVAFLSTCLFAKCLEAKTTRDVLIIFNFALFVSASLLLHSQAFWMAVIVLTVFVMCLLGLYRIQTGLFNQTKLSSNQFKQDIQQIFKFVGIAVPFFLILFIFFPRLPPLWAIPIQSNQAITGISDRMSPGDIAQLSQSSALAFRVVANMSQFPSRSELYWRALVLDQYDGVTWTSSFFNQQVKNVQSTSRSVPYQYLAADEHANWIMGLEYSIPQERYLQLYQDNSIRPTQLVKRNVPIQMLWLGRMSGEAVVLSPSEVALNLKFDPDRDVKAQQLAYVLFEQSQKQPEKYLQSVLAWYRKNGFVYTLAPGILGGDRIDQFLFASRKGFCEHYASSFVMLMRYAGIPARVVTGYQGGQLAPDGQSWEVRQLDAHAWSEVYLNGKWQRIDPTAMIAPQRIDTGMQDYLVQDQSIWGDETKAWRLQQFKFLNNMRIWSDYLSYQWQSKVVGYDAEKQKNWLSRSGLDSSYAYVIVLIVSIGTILVIYAGIYWWRQRGYQTDYQRAVFKFQKKLPKNLHKQPAETFQVWMQRLATQVQDKQVFEQAIVLYQKIVFLERQDGANIEEFKRLLKDCAIALKQSQKNL